MPNEELPYDFIVVGAGASGCAIASGLVRSNRLPRVLLLEAGGANNDATHRDLRALPWRTPMIARSAWTPAKAWEVDRHQLTSWSADRVDEWDEIARVTGDDCWRWENVEPRFRRLENYHHLLEPGTGAERYCSHGPGAYGTSGLLHLTSQTTKWKTDLTQTADVWEACGYPLITDMSAGDYFGLLFSPLTGYQGVRSTAADLLHGAPPNLEIETESMVQRVLVTDGKAIGVELTNGRILECGKEVILSAGALSTPQILMRSGIGPEQHLNDLGIPVLHANDSVGKNLRDHCHVQMHFSVDDSSIAHLFDGLSTGGTAMGFLRSNLALTSVEFQLLPKPERERLSLPTVPTFEVHHFTPAVRQSLQGMGPTSMINLFLLNGQGLGEVRLRSSDPETPPIICPSFLEHDWDKRIVIESTRECLRVMDHAAASKSRDPKAIHICPKSDSEEDILEFWRDNLTSTWHMNGTCRIGRTQEEEGACIDPDFRVYGVHNLRVVDMSVLPFLPSVHTQSYAYQIGMIAAEKIIHQYVLNAVW